MGFKDFALYFILIFLIGIVYWFAFYPAGMSTDSLNSWNQIHTENFNDWHPIIFTWTMMLLSWLWDSPASMSLFQILMVSLVFAYSFWQFEKLGIKKYLLVLMCCIMAIIPSFAVFTIILWKDILFSASLSIFTVQLFLIMHSNGQWLVKKPNILLFFLSSFGVVFFRHNGYLVFVLSMIVLLICYFRQVWKTAGMILFVLLVFQQVLTGPIFRHFHVTPSDPNEVLAIPTQQIANIIKNDGKLSQYQYDYYNSIFSMKLWKERYNPYTVDPIKFAKGYHREVIFKDFPKYLKLWGQAIVQNPSLAAEAYLKQTSLVWQLMLPDDGYIYTYRNFIIANHYGLVSSPISSSLNEQINTYLADSLENKFVRWVWRPVVYALFIFIFAIPLLLRNGWRSSIVIMPFLFNTLAIAVALPAQDFRYLLPSVFISFVFPFMAMIRQVPKRDYN